MAMAHEASRSEPITLSDETCSWSCQGRTSRPSPFAGFYAETVNNRWRLVFLIPGGAAMLVGTVGAVALLGVEMPALASRWGEVHGVLMVLGFIGTLIALERAVALRRRWALLAPGLLGLGGIALMAPLDLALGGTLLVLGACILLLVYGALWRRQARPELAVQVCGAAMAAGGALIWLGGAPVATAVPWLAAFIVLTIAGERAELTRIERPHMPQRVLLASGVPVAGVLAATLWPDAGSALLGAAALVLTGVLLFGDVALHTIRGCGHQRFAGWAMLAGYLWLAMAGAAWLVGGVAIGPAYDAVIHAIFLGFAVSMIMAHAPMILPAVLRIALPYRSVMYGPLVLLHASLVVRLLIGDAYGHAWAVTAGGLLNVVALLAFVVTAVSSAVIASRRAPQGTAATPAAQEALT